MHFKLEHCLEYLYHIHRASMQSAFCPHLRGLLLDDLLALASAHLFWVSTSSAPSLCLLPMQLGKRVGKLTPLPCDSPPLLPKLAGSGLGGSQAGSVQQRAPFPCLPHPGSQHWVTFGAPTHRLPLQYSYTLAPVPSAVKS